MALPPPPFTVLFQNDDVIAVSKTSGISVGGERWEPAVERLDRLVEAEIGGRVFAVHRIDKETSGVVLFAKTAAMHKELCRAFEERLVQKTYIALVHGKPAWRETVCELGLVPNGNKKHQTIVDMHRGKKSLTRFFVMASAGNYAALRVHPETGRTHQIRVSLAWLRHPVICDGLYGSLKPLRLSAFKRAWRGNAFAERPLIERLALHAAELRLPEALCPPPYNVITAPLPKDMKAALNQLKKNGQSYE